DGVGESPFRQTRLDKHDHSLSVSQELARSKEGAKNRCQKGEESVETLTVKKERDATRGGEHDGHPRKSYLPHVNASVGRLRRLAHRPEGGKGYQEKREELACIGQIAGGADVVGPIRTEYRSR